MGTQAKLILMRHGQSLWNKENLFTGWVDIPLSSEGIEEALRAGRKMSSWQIDVIFASSLLRAQMTAMLVMSEHKADRMPVIVHSDNEFQKNCFEIHDAKIQEKIIPVYCAWQLNERMYGDLQGLNKQETMDKYGPEQVKMWRRSYDVAPPGGESLKMTADRVIPFFKSHIYPILRAGKNVFVSAHGNSLRAILMFLMQLSSDEVVHLELATGEPIVLIENNGFWVKES
ncbi:MAG: 2,3-bisphosphoglycerate-dependent phosphoglycerate mutase [Chlamydiae bacterium]|nr:2,3-bisphosphoglycerate-dependent phosphoglycerate mutase [Chlamydiota bacterium]